jgi:hypothetical protein
MAFPAIVRMPRQLSPGFGGLAAALIAPTSSTPTNAVIERSGTVVTQRDGTIVVDQRP